MAGPQGTTLGFLKKKQNPHRMEWATPHRNTITRSQTVLGRALRLGDPKIQRDCAARVVTVMQL